VSDPDENRPPSDETTSKDVPRRVRIGNRALEMAEGVVYVGIAAFLVVTALSLLVVVAREIPSLFGSDAGEGMVALQVLDTLLLVFIVVELLFAVRITIAKRELIAEPFLLVGIIASIKEIVVLSVEAADQVGTPEFMDSLMEIGVLGFLVLLLGVTAWLLRIKEREPGEGDASEPYEPDGAKAKPKKS